MALTRSSRRRTTTVLLTVWLTGCTKPVDNQKFLGLAATLHGQASMAVTLCQLEYESYLVNPAASPKCLTGDAEAADRALDDALMLDGLPRDAVSDYRVVFDATMKSVESTIPGETKGGYAARQAANKDKFEEAGVRLEETMRTLKRK